MKTVSLLFLLLIVTSASGEKPKPSSFYIYNGIKSFFDVDLLFELHDGIPIKFNNCHTTKNKKTIAYSEDGILPCLFNSTLHQQFHPWSYKQLTTKTEIYFKDSDRVISATVKFSHIQIIKHLRNLNNDIFLADINIILDESIKVSEINNSDILMALANLGYLEKGITQLKFSSVLSDEKDEYGVPIKIFKFNFYEHVGDRSPIFNMQHKTNYNFFNKDTLFGTSELGDFGALLK